MTEDSWASHMQGAFPLAARPDIAGFLASADSICAVHVAAHLGPWIALFDEALAFLYLLQEEAEACVRESRVPGVFASVVARALALCVAIRRLTVSGLDDAARILARAHLETNDIALACLLDDGFAHRYLHLGHQDQKKFWNREIARGKLMKFQRVAFVRMQLEPAKVDWYQSRRAGLLEYFSGPVHGSSNSAVLSFAIPSLAHPGRLARAPFGHVSVHAPKLLWIVAEEVQLFSFLVMHLMMCEPTPTPFTGHNAGPRRESLFVSHFVLSDLLGRLDGQWPGFVDVD